MIAIDTETYYDNLGCSVKDLGPEAYSRHPLAKCYMVSVAGEGLSYSGPPEDAPWAEMDGKEWCAHNSHFDKHINAQLIRDGKNPGALPKYAMTDTAAIPAYLQVGRSLDVAARILLQTSHSKRLRTASAGKQYEAMPEATKQAMLDYALTDAELCLGLYEKHGHKLPTEEWELSELTIEAADQGINIDVETLNTAHARLGELRENLIAQIPWSDGDLLGATAIGQLRRQVKTDNIPGMPASTSKSDLEWNAWYDKWSPQYPYIQAYKDLGRLNKHFATIDTIHRRVSPEGLLRYSFMYCGSAVTKRWSGGQKEGRAYQQKDSSLNLQNLTKAEYFDTPIRPLLIPRPDHDFLIADLSNIEPRCLAWMIGDKAFLDSIRAGVDIYEAHARASMGYTDPRPLKVVDNDMRQLAKVRCLSLPYGTGWMGFQRAMVTNGIDLTQGQAKASVNNFRNQNPRIVGFWNNLQATLEGSLGEEAEIELPTGSVMTYYEVRRESFLKFGKPGVGIRTTVERGHNERKEFWGAKLTENFIQHLARDVFAWKLLALHRAGLKILWHVHDEVILEVHKSQTKDAMAQVMEILTTEDPRLPGLPIGCDAHVAQCYDK